MGKNIIIAILSIVLVILFIKITWNSSDLDWVCALGSAIITGLITWFAVYETSNLDRKARKHDSNKQLYRQKLLELNELIEYLQIYNSIYFGTGSEKDKGRFVVTCTSSEKTKKMFYIFNFLKLLSPDSVFAEFQDKHMQSFLALNSFFHCDCEKNYRTQEDFIVAMKQYIQNRNNGILYKPEFENIDYSDKAEIINKMKKTIEDEFKLDEK